MAEWLRRLIGGKEDLRPHLAVPHEASHPGEPHMFADGNNDCAVAMYGQLRQPHGNLFFCPFGIRTALVMAHAGARGETAAQMREALRLPSSDEALHGALAEIIGQLNAAGGDEYEMTVANSLWGQDDAPLQPAFLDLVARRHAGAVNLVDFRDAAESARTAINRWVEDKTRRKIRDLVPAGGLDADTRLVLVNAVYFNGLWSSQFSGADTKDRPFHLDNDRKVTVPLMFQRERVLHLQAADYQAVELIYRGGDLSMLVLLPNRRDGLRQLEDALSVRMLRDCATRMTRQEVELFLPRFKITWGCVNMRESLAALGMPLAFTRSSADFSGMNGYEPPAKESLFLSAVFHKAFVAVNETGTEAAAATAVAHRCLEALDPVPPPPVPIFRADHPFLFAIRDRKTGTILFLGRVVDPTK